MMAMCSGKGELGEVCNRRTLFETEFDFSGTVAVKEQSGAVTGRLSPKNAGRLVWAVQARVTNSGFRWPVLR